MQGFDPILAGTVVSVHRVLEKVLLTLTYSMAQRLS
jgi:hypothetical protein